MMNEVNEDIADTMVRIAMDAIRNSYVDHDGIAAGACVLTSDGTLYNGCRIDHPIPYLSISAEMAAMIKAIVDGKREFDGLAIVADIEGFYVPDENTYEFLLEMGVPEIVFADLDGNVKIMSIEEVEPYRPRRRD
ncbi:MAG: cytidine deaminase [Selenomonadaceae bacterium]|nr:cytidine deaminase [Selenomonadaceae bacterium]